MNWTEGTLARHSRRKGWDQEAARQKEYFAKQRARLHQNPRRPDPVVGIASFVPSYISRSPRSTQDEASLRGSRRRNVAHKRLVHLSSETGSDKTTASELDPSSGPHLGGRSSSSVTVDTVEAIEAKRRKLLDKADWTGIGFQKPLFAGSPEFGTRQGEHTVDRNKKKPPRERAHLVGSRPRGHRNSIHQSHIAPNARLDNRIDIRVGSQDFRWSHKSNSIRSHPDDLSSLPTIQDWVSQRHSPGSPYTHSHMVHDNVGPSDSARLSQLVQRRPRVARQCTPRPAGSSQGNWRAGRTAHSTLQERRVSDEAQIIVRSSPPRMYHPRPGRTSNLVLYGMRSPSLEPEDSVLVQVGDSSRSAQHNSYESIMWKDWLTSPGKKQHQGDITRISDAASPPRSTTPGVSHFWESPEPVAADVGNKPLAVPLQDAAQNESTACVPSEPELLSLPHEALPEDALPGYHPGLCFRGPNTEIHGNLEQSGAPIGRLTVQGTLKKTGKVLDLMDLMDRDRGRDEQQAQDLPPTEPESDRKHEDDVWKKFILDENSSEINRKAREEAQEQMRRQLRQVPREPLLSDLAEPPSRAHSVDPSTPAADPSGRSLRVHSSPRNDCAVACAPHFSPKQAGGPDTAATVAASSVIAQRGSPSPKAQEEEFKFHQPRLFVGRLASSQGPAAAAATTTGGTADAMDGSGQRPVTRGGGSRRGISGGGRRKRARELGRPDIRALPNFEGDPIEESP